MNVEELRSAFRIIERRERAFAHLLVKYWMVFLYQDFPLVERTVVQGQYPVPFIDPALLFGYHFAKTKDGSGYSDSTTASSFKAAVISRGLPHVSVGSSPAQLFIDLKSLSELRLTPPDPTPRRMMELLSRLEACVRTAVVNASYSRGLQHGGGMALAAARAVWNEHHDRLSESYEMKAATAAIGAVMDRMEMAAQGTWGRNVLIGARRVAEAPDSQMMTRAYHHGLRIENAQNQSLSLPPALAHSQNGTFVLALDKAQGGMGDENH